MEDEMGFCSNCNETFTVSELSELNNQLYCEECSNIFAGSCEQCGVAIFGEDNYGSSDLILCESCYDSHYTSCSACDRIISNNDACYLESDDDRCFCDHCYSERVAEDEDETYILNYNFKPKPIFFGKGERYFGIELEIDHGGKSESNAKALLDIANCDDQEFIYIKGDSSLDSGLEIVTHPMTLEFHKTQMPWREILDKCISLNYKSHSCQSCGLHIHQNRDCIATTSEDQDEVISKILFFVEKNWDQLFCFSRRKQQEINRWAAKLGYREDPKEILDNAKKAYNGRYSAINLLCPNTIEWRIFKGTLRLNTLLAAIQLVDEVLQHAIVMSEEDFKSESWQSFVLSIDAEKKHELIEYLKIKRLYVNEAIETESDN